MAAVLMTVCAAMPAKAQSADDEQKYDYTFNPHWFIQLQGGIQHTIGEVAFSELLSPNAQLGVGYEFNPVLALRLSANAWQSKAGTELLNLDGTFAKTQFGWKWNYVAPTLDAMIDLTNLLGGFNPDRKIGAGIFAGIGANIAFKNDEAATAKQDMDAQDPAPSAEYLPYLWDGTKALLAGRFGANVDWHFNDNWSAGLEVQANLLGDAYNSKRAHNADWYINTLVGVKYCFGKPADRKPKEKMIPVSEAANYAPACDPVEVVKEVPVEKIVEKTVPQLMEEIYFTINKYTINSTEKYKVRQIAEFMKENPDAKLTVTGHADSATGTAKYNQQISEKRVDTVVKSLVDDYGVDESRISKSAKGDTENKYSGDEMSLNRVCICVAK